MKRNPSVELMRIIACLTVLMCHCNLLLNKADCNYSLEMYLTGILSDGVTVFFMITGFFIFNNTSYKKLWRHTFFRIVIPLLVLYITDLFFTEFLTGKCSVTDSLSHGVENITSYLISIVHLDTPSPAMSHTWYVFAYLIIILIFPIIKPFVMYLNDNKTAQKVFIIISATLWILNDILMNKLFGFAFHGAGVIIPSTLLVIWGYVIYQNRYLMTHKVYIIISPVIFLLINALRMLSMTIVEEKFPDENANLFVWYSFFGVINALLVISFCLSVIRNNKPNATNRFICYMASFTFGIYLIHPILQELAKNYGFFTYLHDTLTNVMPTWAYLIIALLISALLSFIACFVICLAIRLVKKLFVLRKKE